MESAPTPELAGFQGRSAPSSTQRETPTPPTAPSFYSLSDYVPNHLSLLSPSSASSPHPILIASPSTELVSPGPAAVAGCPGDSHTPALERELIYEVREEARGRHGGGRADTRACARLQEQQRVTEHVRLHTTHTPICLLSLEEL